MKNYTILESLVHPRYSYLTGFKLSTGDVFTIMEFLNYCETAATELYCDYLTALITALELSGKEFTKSGDFKIKIGSTTIRSLHKWGLELKADKESEEKVARIANFRGVPLTPGTAAIQSYVGATRNQDVSNILLGEALCSFTEENGIDKDSVPAYRAGLIGMAATPGKFYKNVKSYDLVSAYPAACLAYSFPYGESTKVDITGEFSIDSKAVIRKGKYTSGKNGYIGKFKVTGAARKPWVKLVALQYSNKISEVYSECEFDDLGLVRGNLTFSACTPELSLFLLQFDYDKLEIVELYTHKMAMLPAETKAIIKDWYRKKLNGGHIEKLKLNSLIGSWGRSPFKFPNKEINSVEDAEKTLSIYNGREGKKPSSMGAQRTWDYRWAIYAVARVRYTMGRIENALYDRGCEVLYSDTDSIKFLGNEGEIFTKYNDTLRKQINLGDLGTFRNESEKYKKGAIFYAKRSYLSADKLGIDVHISGMNKEAAKAQLGKKKLRRIANRPLKLYTPVWTVAQLPSDRLGMLIVPQRGLAAFTIKA